MFPAITDSAQAQLEAYKVMENDELFNLEAVRVKLKPEDLPGRPRSRVTCEQCSEGVNDGRERRRGDRVLCRSCAGEQYYELVTSDE
jgi:formylmethanofuran dehydrogenase subunit E